MSALSRKLDVIAPLLAQILLEGHPESHQLTNFFSPQWRESSHRPYPKVSLDVLARATLCAIRQEIPTQTAGCGERLRGVGHAGWRQTRAGLIGLAHLYGVH
jgi:hypothetical protein